MNLELAALFETDQEERRQNTYTPEADRARRLRVEQLVREGRLHTAEDHFHAAAIYQHGEQADHYWAAYELARKAADMGHERARRLAAAAYDRWLTAQGKPQKFGTQFLKDSSGWRLMPVDPLTTDQERAAWGVPSLAESQRFVERLNGGPK